MSHCSPLFALTSLMFSSLAAYAATSPSTSHEQSAIITVSQTVPFLNAAARDLDPKDPNKDLHHLYCEGMSSEVGLIRRTLVNDHFVYEALPEKENHPITDFSLTALAHYCNWQEAGAPTLEAGCSAAFIEQSLNHGVYRFGDNVAEETFERDTENPNPHFLIPSLNDLSISLPNNLKAWAIDWITGTEPRFLALGNSASDTEVILNPDDTYPIITSLIIIISPESSVNNRTLPPSSASQISDVRATATIHPSETHTSPSLSDEAWSVFYFLLIGAIIGLALYYIPALVLGFIINNAEAIAPLLGCEAFELSSAAVSLFTQVGDFWSSVGRFLTKIKENLFPCTRSRTFTGRFSRWIG